MSRKGSEIKEMEDENKKYNQEEKIKDKNLLKGTKMEDKVIKKEKKKQAKEREKERKLREKEIKGL